MCAKLTKRSKRIFTPQDWKDADALGRIEIHLANPEYFQLTDEEEKYYVRLRKTFHVVSECQSELKAFRMLKDVFPTSDSRTIHKLIHDTQQLFSKMISRNVEFDRILQSDRILNHIQDAKEQGDFKAVARLEKIYSEIRGTDKHTEAGFKWDDLQLPEVYETNDPAVLFDEAQVVDE